MTLFTLPPYPLPWLPPRAPELFQLFLDFRVAVGLDITGIADRPLLKFCWLSRTFGAADMSTLLTDGGRGRHKRSLAFVAGALDPLLGRLVCQFVACPCRDCEDTLLLRLLASILLFLLLGRSPLLGRISRAFLAPLVLTLKAHFLRTIYSTTVVAAAMNTHANRFLYTLHGRHRGRRSNPLVRLKSEAVFGKQSTRSFLLHRVAIELSHQGWRHRRRRRSGGGGGGRRRGFCGRISRHMFSVE
jgi:hypothetical protein